MATASEASPEATVEVAPPGFPEHRITSERYQKMVDAGVFDDGEPIFLWDGKLVEEMTKGAPHNFASVGLNELLVKLLPPGWIVRGEQPVTLAPDFKPEPDFTVARGAKRDYLSREVLPTDIALCIEIADSSLAQDARVKLPAYALAGIPIYWLVNIPHRRLEVYAQPTEAQYASRRDYGPGDEVPVVLDGREVGRIAASEFLP